MKSIVWTGPRQMILEDVPLPGVKPGEALVRVHSVGICGSELSSYLGQNSLRVPPLVMGHEFSGEVTAVGKGVASLAEGMRVVINPLITCGECDLCRMGLDSLCATRRLIGVHQAGAFAEFAAVPAKNCLPLPEKLGLLSASLAEPLACGVRAAKLGKVQPGTRVAVFGAGAIGLQTMTAVQEAGGEVVLAVEVNPGRLAHARTWGAQALCNPYQADPAQTTQELTGGLGADVVIDAVGSTATRRAAVEAVRPGGTVVLVGLHQAESALQANHMVRSEIHLNGSFAYTPADFAQAVDLLAKGRVIPSSDWLEERPLEACDASFAELIDDAPAVAKIILHP